MDKLNMDVINCTGAQFSPTNKKKMLEAVKKYPPDIEGDAFVLAKERVQKCKEADPMGTVALYNVMKNNHKDLSPDSEIFLDKLGERLAYERSGVRFYEAAIAKADAFKRKDLSKEMLHIKEEEVQHMVLVSQAITRLGGDPTEMTPCADLSGVMGQGYMQVLTDPRTNIAQTLNTLLSIELTDNAAWELLINLALKNDQEKIAQQFQTALEEEEKHLIIIKHLLENELQITNKFS
ncbi:DUF892 family protein [Legionella sp. km772]|uniref:DUF892 family protein n=1 Tax=Legionella sp. km772 TaxID=2498111 RepID=UPI000F8E6500|nr:ferritin-like domain-containing protein [Legionella sp. km772]RUR09799.1 ferritin-like domain-containing protein [Legionella sp. km772]